MTIGSLIGKFINYSGIKIAVLLVKRVVRDCVAVIDKSISCGGGITSHFPFRANARQQRQQRSPPSTSALAVVAELGCGRGLGHCCRPPIQQHQSQSL